MAYRFVSQADGDWHTPSKWRKAHPILGLAAGYGYLYVSGDATAEFQPGDTFTIAGNSNGNDGSYTVVSSEYNAGNTLVYVSSFSGSDDGGGTATSDSTILPGDIEADCDLEHEMTAATDVVVEGALVVASGESLTFTNGGELSAAVLEFPAGDGQVINGDATDPLTINAEVVVSGDRTGYMFDSAGGALTINSDISDEGAYQIALYDGAGDLYINGDILLTCVVAGLALVYTSGITIVVDGDVSNDNSGALPFYIASCSLTITGSMYENGAYCIEDGGGNTVVVQGDSRMGALGSFFGLIFDSVGGSTCTLASVSGVSSSGPAVMSTGTGSSYTVGDVSWTSPDPCFTFGTGGDSLTFNNSRLYGNIVSGAAGDTVAGDASIVGDTKLVFVGDQAINLEFASAAPVLTLNSMEVRVSQRATQRFRMRRLP